MDFAEWNNYPWETDINLVILTGQRRPFVEISSFIVAAI